MAVGPLDSSLLTTLVVSHVGAVLLTLGIAVYVARTHWQKPLGRTFTLLVGSFLVWILGSFGRLFTTDPDVYVAVTTVKYVGITTAPVLFLFFALLYDGRKRWVNWRTAVALFVLPALTLLVLATTRVHGLFYSGFTTATIGPVTVLATRPGPWFWLWASYGWGLLVVASVLVAAAGLRRSGFYRAQSAVVVLAILVPWTVNFAYVFFQWPHPALDPTPLGFAVTSLLFALGIFSTQLIDVVPAARSLVMDAMDDGVVVLDPQARVVDVNDAARSLFDAESSIGRSVAEVLPPELVRADSPETVELTVDGEARIYRYRQLPVGPGGTHGEVIVLTDVTTQVRTRRDLERQNERLEEFASVVSHDLRNPLNVAQGNLEVIGDDADADRVGRVRRALDRMETLVDDLLSLARHGERVEDPEPVALDGVAAEAWQTVETEDATLELADDLDAIRADRKRVVQLFENLFANAVEHGGEAVTVRVGALDGGFFVEDDGAGFPVDDPERLFERGVTTAADGTGFGLAIVDTIVEAHGWEITPATGDDGGARFEVTDVAFER